MLLSNFFIFSEVIIFLLFIGFGITFIVMLVKKHHRKLFGFLTLGAFVLIFLFGIGIRESAIFLGDDYLVDKLTYNKYKKNVKSLGVVVKAFNYPSDENTDKALEQLNIQKKFVEKYKNSGKKRRALSSIKTLKRDLNASYSSKYESLYDWQDDMLLKDVGTSSLVASVSKINFDTFQERNNFTNKAMRSIQKDFAGIPGFVTLIDNEADAQDEAYLESEDEDDDYDVDDLIDSLYE